MDIADFINPQEEKPGESLDELQVVVRKVPASELEDALKKLPASGIEDALNKHWQQEQQRVEAQTAARVAATHRQLEQMEVNSRRFAKLVAAEVVGQSKPVQKNEPPKNSRDMSKTLGAIVPRYARKFMERVNSGVKAKSVSLPPVAAVDIADLLLTEYGGEIEKEWGELPERDSVLKSIPPELVTQKTKKRRAAHDIEMVRKTLRDCHAAGCGAANATPHSKAA